ncbi:3'-5' exoribonuclease 1-like [Neocloeon triangulifer]|uniref:3'-5' exoribonuclease 1-like n=1 Tax=Neocloeon triangulifer TaxID=2078957 RepID=UPI00286F54BD|nr:3'-5' exoribonuclease 1-like [Neocloeon triangulifer]
MAEALENKSALQAKKLDSKKLSKLNREINNLSLQDAQLKLQLKGANDRGSVEVLRKRLKALANPRKPSTSGLQEDQLPFYVVIDFEATCEQERDNSFPHEIIEFPALLIDTRKKEIVDQFHMFCKPKLNPTLSEFCISLTGITQDVVDSAEPFSSVLAKFDEWLKSHGLVGAKRKHKFSFVTDGPWDFSKFLLGQCKLTEVPFPTYCRKYINLQRAFASHYKCRKTSLNGMLQHLALEFEGRQHCGLDDAKNISRILVVLISEFCSLVPNERCSADGHVHHI